MLVANQMHASATNTTPWVLWARIRVSHLILELDEFIAGIYRLGCGFSKEAALPAGLEAANVRVCISLALLSQGGL